MRTTFLKFSKKMVALFLGCLLIFSAFGVCGVLSVSAKDADYCIKVEGSETAPGNGGRHNVVLSVKGISCTVTFSYYYKSTSGVPGFRVQNKDSGTIGTETIVNDSMPAEDNGAGWKTYTVDNITAESRTISLWFHNGDMSKDGEFYIADITVIEEGSTENIFPTLNFEGTPADDSWKMARSELFTYVEKPILETEEPVIDDYCIKVEGSETATGNGGRHNVVLSVKGISCTVTFSYYYKSTSGVPGFRVQNKDSGTIGTETIVNDSMPAEDNGAGWKTYTVDNITAESRTIGLWFHNGDMSNDGEFYIADITVIEEGSTENIFPTLNFEGTPTDDGWRISKAELFTYVKKPTLDDGELDTEETITADYALQVIASQQYKELYQVFNVSADTDYVVKLDIKSVGANNTQLRVYPGSGTGSPTRLVSQMLSSTAWTTVTYEFNSGSNTQVTLSFITTVLNASMYTGIDNISIYKKADETAVIYEEDFASGSLTDYTAASGLIGTVFNIYNKDAYDYNGDGKVDIRDLVRIARYLLDSTIEISLYADDNGTIEEADIAATRTVLLERY